METRKGRSVPVMEEFQVESSWVPPTPVKPSLPPRPQLSPIYNDGYGGGGLMSQGWVDQEDNLSRYTQQNHTHAQTLLSYSINSSENNNIIPTTSNNIWDVNHGASSSGRIQIQRDNTDVQRRGLEDCLLHWSSQGRRSQLPYGSSNIGPNSYSNSAAWETSQPWTKNVLSENDNFTGRNSTNPLDNLDATAMSFKDLIGFGGSLTLQTNSGLTGNGGCYPGWVSQPEGSLLHSNTILGERDYLHGVTQQSIGIQGRGLQNGAVPPQYQYVNTFNSPSSTKHANRSSTFAPETPDSWQRMASDAASGSTNPVTNIGFDEQKLLHEHDVVAALIDLQDNHNEKAPGTATETSPDENSVAVEEDHNPDKGGNQVLDLNQTPQKKARRRRYQPKVIRESKPKSTPKPKTPKTTETQIKRKYMRKDKTNTPAMMPAGEATEAGEPKSTKQPARSCKKSLNFDLNGQVAEEDTVHMTNDGLEAEPAANLCQIDKSRQPVHVHVSKGEDLMINTSILSTAYDLNLSVNQELRDYISLPTKEHLASSQTDINDLSRKKEKHSVSWSRIDAELLFSPCASSNEGEQNRGSKRRLSYTTDPIYVEAEPAAVSHSIPWQLRNISPRSTQTEILPQSFIPEICKKKRTEKVQRSSAANTSPASEIVSQEAKAHSHSTSKYYCNPVPFGLSLMANHQGKVFTGKPESMEQLQKTWADLSRLKKKKRSKGATRVRDLAQLTGIASAAKGALLKKKATTTEPNSCTGTLMSIHTRTEVQSAERSVKPRSKRRPMKQDSVNKSRDLVIYNNYHSTKRTTGSAPAASRRKSSSVEEITRRMERLDLIEKVRRTRRQEQRALVPYRARRQEQTALVPYGQEDSIVPFDGPFNPIRKRRQRAKVELDDETTRVWRLLLENIDNEGINGTDEDKANWWENERRVFRGRVDSFIARMRLVQGDRRFTPWKGSVLDSVIGVFLTQNVSDHLSSSAFMSMAARFPLKPESPGSTLSEEATSILVEEPDICELEHEESITWNVKTMDQPTLDRNSRVLHDSDQSEEKEVVDSKEPFGKSGSVSPTEDSSEICQRAPSYSKADNANRQTAETEINYILGDDKPRDDATSSQQSAISSQNSINSPNLHTAGIMNTFSESNSRIEAMATSSQFNYGDYTTSFMGLLKMVEPPPNEAYGQTYLQIPTGDMKHTTEYFTEAPGVSSSIYGLNLEAGFYLQDTKGNEMLEVESKSDDLSRKDENSPATEQSNVTSELTDPEKNSDSILGATHNMCSFYVLEGENMVRQSKGQTVNEPVDTVASSAHAETTANCKGIHVPQSSHETACVGECTTEVERTEKNPTKVEQTPTDNYASGVISDMINPNPSKTGRGKPAKGKKNEFDWDSLRRDAEVNGHNRGNTANTQDSLDWEAVRHADVREIADTIKERGMNNMLAERIKDLLDRLVRDHGSINMEWLRDIPPDKAKEYLLSFRGLGLKSVECVRLLTLHHLAFPVDTNVGRIAVRLGWVPLQPLPESLQLHLLELYPVLESIQKYLWPRLCKLDQKTLYELHYHMITFGKVFCTKRQPNCNACPLRGECRHFASAFASARFALPGPEERSIIPSVGSNTPYTNTQASIKLLPSTSSCGNHNPHIGSQQNNASAIQASSFPFSLPFPQNVHLERKSINSICEPIVEVPASPEPEAQQEQELGDIEDTFYDDPNEIPTIQLNMKEFTQTLQNFMHSSRELQEAEVSKALVALTAEAASLPTPKLKNISRLRTEHHVYELPDTHPLLHGMNRREPDDPCSYLLAIWTPGETADSIDPPARKCSFEDPSMLCNEETCSYCSSHHEANTQTVRGTLLIPCRTAMRGSFPLNGTYFQVNEVFADHDSSLNPIAVPRTWLWNLPRRTVYFGTSIPTLFRGMTTEDIQHCFWRGYVCVRGFDQKSRAPRPLMARLHFPASKMVKGAKGKTYDE